MYKSPQNKKPSWTPSTVQKKGKKPSKLGHFSIQPKPHHTSAPSQEIGEYSRDYADRLTANVMRSLQTRGQELAEESTLQPKFESPWASGFEPPIPLPESPASKLKGAFASVSENQIQRQCAECAKKQVEQKGEERKEIDEIGIQTKLTVGAPGDAYEQEADQVAAQVMSMPDNSPHVQKYSEANYTNEIWKRAQSIKPVVQRVVDPSVEMGQMVQRAHQMGRNQPSSLDANNTHEIWKRAHSIKPVVQRVVDPSVEMGQMVQRAHQMGRNQASGDLESRLNASKGGGSPLSEDVKGFMEPRFGADFSGVRVHTGGEAVQMNQELGAQAFTHGSDVYFGQGKTPGNNELTAHELTHVVQQSSSTNSSIQRECGVDESCMEMPNASYAPEMPNASYAPEVPNASYAPEMPNASYAPEMPNASYAPEMPNASYAPEMPNASYAPEMPRVDVDHDPSSGRILVYVESVLTVEVQLSDEQEGVVDVKSHWEPSTGLFQMNVTVPPGADAEFSPSGPEQLAAILPNSEISVTEESQPLLPELLPTEKATALEAETTDSEEGIASFLEGAILGDFGKNNSYSAIAGQTAIGFIPIVGQIADARDIAAAIGDIAAGEEGGWLNLGIAGLGIIPGLDFLKGSTRAGRRVLGEAAEEMATAGRRADDLVEPGVRSIDPEIDEMVEKNFLEHTGSEVAEEFSTSQKLIRGNLGERLAAESLAVDGHRILSYKPSILGTNQGGIDIVTIQNGVVYLIDNKALTRSGNVSSVSALTTNFSQNLVAVRNELGEALMNPSIPANERNLFRQAIDALESGNYVRAVTNANFTPDDRILSGVTEKLQKEGIEFIDVFH